MRRSLTLFRFRTLIMVSFLVRLWKGSSGPMSVALQQQCFTIRDYVGDCFFFLLTYCECKDFKDPFCLISFFDFLGIGLLKLVGLSYFNTNLLCLSFKSVYQCFKRWTNWFIFILTKDWVIKQRLLLCFIPQVGCAQASI